MPTGTTSCFFPLRYAALRTASSSLCSASYTPGVRVVAVVPGWLFLTAGCPTSPYPYAKYTSIHTTHFGVGLSFRSRGRTSRLLEWVAKFLTNRFFSCSALSLHFFYLPAGARPHFTGRRKIYGDFPAF